MDINPDYQRGYNDGYAAAKRERMPKGDLIEAASRIYSLYPRKVGKQAAIRVIAKALLTVDAEELAAKVSDYANATATWPEADRQFIPHPATWFNRGSWEDDPATWRRGVVHHSQFSRTY